MKIFIAQGVKVPWYAQKKLSTLTLFQWFQPQLPLIASDGKKGRKKEVVFHITFNVTQNINSV